MTPVCWHGEIPLYSAFQIWEVYHLLVLGLGPDSAHEYVPLRNFWKLLHLLLNVQDFYLPEVRSDLRMGVRVEYGRHIITNSGVTIRTSTTYPLSCIRKIRSDAIGRRRFTPSRILEISKLDGETLLGWIQSIRRQAEALDPLEPWKDLVRFVSYEKRQGLKGDALLAQHFYEIAEILTLFARDLGIVDASLESRESECLAQPYTMLEYLANEFELNPKPRAIIFTEGEEWRGLRKLYIRSGINPDLLGIEFHSLCGGGNFSVERWQGFVEYMHEKQVIIYFLLDKENKVKQQMEKFLRVDRMLKVEPLRKLMPEEGQGSEGKRIWVWGKSFEEEFSDQMISLALAEQGIHLSRQKIGAVRRKNREKGLIEALLEALPLPTPKLDKGLLSESLVAKLTLIGPKENKGRKQTMLEKFVWVSAQSIILNHQPVDSQSRRENFETGGLG